MSPLGAGVSAHLTAMVTKDDVCLWAGRSWVDHATGEFVFS
jgi:hypothetical protein